MEGVPVKKSISIELKDLFDKDQSDRQELGDNWDDADRIKQLMENDAARLKRAREIYSEYEKGSVMLSDEERVQLAFLFQHSAESDDYRKAYELANSAGESGAWIAAAAEDRWLLSRGEKQKWGTQFTRDNERAPMLSDEEAGITDEMRKERGIPAREEQLAEHLRLRTSEE